MGTRASKDQRDSTPSLVERLRAHDPGAGVLLNDQYRKQLLRFCHGYLGRPEDAEDAVQDIFLKVLNANYVPDPDSFQAWLYKVSRNHCLNLCRARARHRDRQAPRPNSQLAADQTSAASHLARAEQRSRVRHMLEALPVEQREVIRLRHTEQLSRAEIAYILDIPESVVKSRLYEGLKKLGEHTSLLG